MLPSPSLALLSLSFGIFFRLKSPSDFLPYCLTALEGAKGHIQATSKLQRAQAGPHRFSPFARRHTRKFGICRSIVHPLSCESVESALSARPLNLDLTLTTARLVVRSGQLNLPAVAIVGCMFPIRPGLFAESLFEARIMSDISLAWDWSSSSLCLFRTEYRNKCPWLGLRPRA
ncbi:hypothetical protein GGR52DRAFT_281386 [Hypoxylon sp. FL1284]|nr:hypothetical protein GGR52DRAFT_281386 [Hypoxylon sp. FL1284]